MLNTKNDFENVGMGISVAGGWIQLEGRKQVWVSLMATSQGSGQRRHWAVSATFHDKSADPVRVMIERANSFRYEAADIALAELLPFIRQKVAA